MLFFLCDLFDEYGIPGSSYLYLVLLKMKAYMSDFIKPGTHNTPAIRLEAGKGLVEIRGSSIMEDTRKFYKPVIDWLKNYMEQPRDTTLHIEFSYFNTSTARTLVGMLKMLDPIKRAGCRLEINWYYPEDDKDIKETGMDFAAVTGLEFRYISRPVENNGK